MTELQFNALAKRYMDMVFRLAFAMTKNKPDADDVTQNVLFSLYRSEKEFESDDHVKNWLVRTTINECKKIWRSPWSRTEGFEAYSETLVFEAPLYSEVYDAILSLDKKSRAVIVLFYCDGYSAVEIADLLHIPVNTVYTRLSRARAKLKRFLSEDDET